MDITYNWIFNSLDCYTEYSGETNVVFNVLWKLVATTTIAGETSQTGGTVYYTYSAKTVGTQEIPTEQLNSFVPFEDLTKQIVQGWVETAMGIDKVNSLKTILQQNIENQINPPIVILTPPWN